MSNLKYFGMANMHHFFGDIQLRCRLFSNGLSFDKDKFAFGMTVALQNWKH
jgi:hypothetical protein